MTPLNALDVVTIIVRFLTLLGGWIAASLSKEEILRRVDRIGAEGAALDADVASAAAGTGTPAGPK